MTNAKTLTAIGSAFVAGAAITGWVIGGPVTAQQPGGTGWQVGGVVLFNQTGVATILNNPQTGRIKICRSSDTSTVTCGASANIGS